MKRDGPTNRQQTGDSEVDGGPRGRFDCAVDHQGRIPSSVFEINGGEKGVIFKY
jgi:hypothetical protein